MLREEIREVKENEIETQSVTERNVCEKWVWKKHSSVIEVLQKGGKVLYDAGS